MSGHSKWSKVKHQKEVTDAAKGKKYTKLTNAIAIAVRNGGGSTDPNSNIKLRLAIAKARDFNLPKKIIERTIERSKGIGQQELQSIVYEAFGPAGVGIIIETATNNKQRTVAEIKNILDRGGGVLAASGAVSHLFQYVGLLQIKKDNKSFDEVMEGALEAGALDLEETGSDVEIYTAPGDLHKVKDKLELAGFIISSSDLFYRPQTVIPINDSDIASQILKLLSSLEESDDVVAVYANFDIPDEYIK